MERSDLPLLLCAPPLASDDEREPLDRLRVQKGVFLLEMRGPRSWRQLYEFEPYDWGPYSRDLANDMSRLVRRGTLVKADVAGRRYEAYRTSPKGEAHAMAVYEDLPPRVQQFVRDVRRFVTVRSFSKLLKDVYGAYPDFAVNSKFSS